MKPGLLIIIAIFLVLLPWIQGNIGINNEVMVDGITTSAIIVMVITLTFSLITWGLLSWATKNITPSGITLGIISGVAIVIPFLEVLGPMAGIIVGITAGFVAFMFQKKMTDPTKNRPIVVASATLAAAYFALIIITSAAQSSHIWDTGDGIGAWTGTPEGMEKSGFDNIFGNNIGFVFFLPIIPSLIVTGLIIRGKKENEI